MFRNTFSEELKLFLESSPESLVVLEPSIRDVLSDHPVLPQSELDSGLLADPVRFNSFCLSDTDSGTSEGQNDTQSK